MGRYRNWTGLADIVDDFRNLAKSGGSVNSEFIDLVEDATLTLIKAESPVGETGEYRNSWDTISKAQSSLAIGTSLPELADILEKGTGGHIIEAKGKFLRFPNADGEIIYRKKVNHPGTKAQPHMSRVSTVLDSLILDFFQQILARQSPGIFGGSMPRVKHESNISGIVGLGKFTSLRGRGTITLHRVRTGRKKLQRRIGLRRRTGAGIISKEFKAL